MFTSRRSLATLTALALLMLVAASCTNTVTGITSADRSAYSAARARWDSRNVDHYSWVYQRGSCECLPEWTRPLYVEVDGATVVALDEETRQAPAYLALTPPPTVEFVFDLIEDAIDEGVHRLHVEYDAVYGYPRVVSIDYHEMYVDDELRIDTRDFVRR